MAQVTGGKVTYLRRVQAAQFEPKEAAVELTFAYEEGEKGFEDFLDQVASAAIYKVHVMIGVEAVRPAAPRPSDGAPMKDVVLAGRIDIGGIGNLAVGDTVKLESASLSIDTMADAILKNPEPAPEPERTKADLAAEKIAEVSDPANIADGPAPRRKPGRPPKVAQPASDPAALSPPLEDTAAAPVQQTDANSDPAALDTGKAPQPASAGATGSDPSSLGDVEDWEAEAPALTDAEVQAKIAATNTRIQNPGAIKQMIYKFAGDPPKTFRDIPAEVRPQFVKELEAL